MKEYYVLSSLCRRILSYSVWSQVREDQNRNNFQLDLSGDEICILVNLINKYYGGYIMTPRYIDAKQIRKE